MPTGCCSPALVQASCFWQRLTARAHSATSWQSRASDKDCAEMALVQKVFPSLNPSVANEDGMFLQTGSFVSVSPLRFEESHRHWAVHSHTKKRECPPENAFAVPLIASMMLMACHPAEPQRVICDSCFSWGLFGRWPSPCDMVSTCTHGLQPCSWHKLHGKRE